MEWRTRTFIMPWGRSCLRKKRPVNKTARARGRPTDAAMEDPEAALGHRVHVPYCSKKLRDANEEGGRMQGDKAVR